VLVKHFNQTTLSSIELDTHKVRNGLPKSNLQQLSKTRWNSILRMILLNVQNRLALNSLSSRNKEVNNVNLNTAEWMMSEDLIKVISKFDLETKSLQGEKYPTLSRVAPVIF